MINIRIELELEINKASIQRTPAQRIFTDVFKGKINKSMPQEPGATLRDDQIKHAFRWDYKTCSILYEDVINYENCIDQIIILLDKVNNAVPIGSVSQRLLRTFWILPSRYDFPTLETRYRPIFIKENSLFQNIYDSTVIIECKIDSKELHHQSGDSGQR